VGVAPNTITEDDDEDEYEQDLPQQQNHDRTSREIETDVWSIENNG
jgi:hypothetical protein